ncbi:hypothetical protein DS565_26260 [Salmonella enterica subsp. enterica serovar Bareilly]|nr:hypothetical protein [Salmonella enterica subsp. enterica serovar Bareilly]
MPVINDGDVFKYIYRTLQSKLVHVQYTAEKATRFPQRMILFSGPSLFFCYRNDLPFNRGASL